MTRRRCDIAIVGGGLAAHTAAATLAEAGADVVMIYPPSPGATALWGGLGQAFGPSTDFLPRSTGQIRAETVARQQDERPFYRRRAERFERLMMRREFHPYRRAQLSADELQRSLARSVAALGYPGLRLLDDERIIPSASASPVAADLAASSVLGSAVASGESVGVVACAALADWSAPRLVGVLDALPDVDAHLLEVSPFADLQAGSSHSVRVATRLGDRLFGDIEALSAVIGEQIGRLGLDAVVFPPCIGATWQEHEELVEALDAALPCRVAEAAAARHSIHGWRLDRFLRANVAVDTMRARATSVDVAGGRLLRVQTDDDSVETESLILATGRWIGGGLPKDAPFREPLLGLDLWIDGAPVPNPEDSWLPGLLAEHVFEDHPLFRAGVATDGALRPLDRDGEPLADNIFAAGRLLAGTNSYWDGTTEGVDLATGHQAAINALSLFGTKEVAS
ncbi:MAG: FAD-binding protein [Persicimonas sp.]